VSSETIETDRWVIAIQRLGGDCVAWTPEGRSPVLSSASSEYYILGAVSEPADLVMSVRPCANPERHNIELIPVRD
jgi:hypothetical protein